MSNDETVKCYLCGATVPRASCEVRSQGGAIRFLCPKHMRKAKRMKRIPGTQPRRQRR